MKYHARSKGFTVSPSALEEASKSMLYAIRHIRDLAGKPRTPYENAFALDHCEYACKGIIDAAEAVGIDLGAKWGNELDVTDA